MAYHEQHERKCPACGERMSATAPKCLNCGEFVDAAGGEEDAPAPRAGWSWLALLVGLVVIAAGSYLLRSWRSDPQAEAVANAQKLHRMMAEKAGGARFNDSSRTTWAEVEPHLRAGMPFLDVQRLVSQKNAGPHNSTVIGTVPLPGEDVEGAASQAYVIYLRDADLIVQTDADQNVASWKREPIR